MFVAPRGWKQAVAQLHQLSDRSLRILGGMFVAAGLVSLYLVRGG